MKIWRGLSKNLLLFCLLLHSGNAFALSNITIMADESVSLAVSRLARDYARQKNVAIATSFVGKDTQNFEIQEGGEANIIITPNKEWLDLLQENGLIDIYSRVEFARGRMALVGAKDNELSIEIASDKEVSPLIRAMNYQEGLLLPSPDTIYNGRFARDALRQSGWMDQLEPYTLYIKNEAELYELVEKQGFFTIMPQSEAMMRPDMRIAGLFPQEDSGLRYYAAVIAGEDMKTARDFIAYLGSKTGAPDSD